MKKRREACELLRDNTAAAFDTMGLTGWARPPNRFASQLLGIARIGEVVSASANLIMSTACFL
jgi:hypothetical protein